MKYHCKNKILITSVEGMGSTLLVALLGRYGYDVGYTQEEIAKVMERPKPKGLEYLRDKRSPFKQERESEFDPSPHIMKYNGWTGLEDGVKRTFLETAEYYGWDVEHVIVPVREYGDWMYSQGVGIGNVAWTPETAYKHYHGRLLELFLHIESKGYDFTVIRFPMLAQLVPYCFHKLDRAMNGIDFYPFKDIFDQTVKLEKITK